MNLKQYNQEQIYKYYDILSKEEKEFLDNQISKIDFELVNKVYKNSYTNEELDINKISPLKIIRKEDININDKTLGEELIKNNQYGVVLMAGGFGSRLGFDIPKGCLELNVLGSKISLFELFINQLKEANKKNNSTIRLYIMTSTTNNEQIIEFFKEHNYFNYKEYIKFFTQEDYPIVDTNGKIVLKNKHEILMGPNGNGDVYKALLRNGLIDDMKKNNIKYVLFSTIDNPLNNMVDTLFIGTTLKYKYKLASKTLSKKDEDDTNWVFLKYKNKPFILPNWYVTKDITNTKVDDKYVYRETNITYHLISIDNIELFSSMDMKYNRNFRNNKFLDEYGILTTSDERNSFKFEKFIFDAFPLADDMLLYSIDESNFRPIKVKEDIKKAEEELTKTYPNKKELN